MRLPSLRPRRGQQEVRGVYDLFAPPGEQRPVNVEQRTLTVKHRSADPSPNRRVRKKPKLVDDRANRCVEGIVITADDAPVRSTDVEKVPTTTTLLRLDSRQLRSDFCDVAEALRYVNISMKPQCVFNEIATTDLLPLQPRTVPVASQYAVVMMVLGSRAIQSPGLLNVSSKGRWRFHHFRQLAIQTLNKDLTVEKTRISAQTFINIWWFIMAELYISMTPEWKPHLEALLALMKAYGDRTESSEYFPQLKLYLTFLQVFGIMANTTSPSSTQIPYFSHSAAMDFCSRMYQNDVLIPNFSCPRPLLLNIIQINALRQQIHNQRDCSDATRRKFDTMAAGIIHQIREFPLNDWVHPKQSFKREWSLVARIYLAAVELFALHALPSPQERGTQACAPTVRHQQCRDLLALLRQARSAPRLKYCVAWPALVAGFAVKRGSDAEREFVDAYLSKLAVDFGSCAPLIGRDTLRRFWASGREGWDECFDRPFACHV